MATANAKGALKLPKLIAMGVGDGIFSSAGLFSIGIPKDSILKYEKAIKSDKFVVVAHGSPDDVQKARDILSSTDTHDIAVHYDAESAQ